MRTAAMSFVGCDGIEVRNGVAIGYDDFAHFDRCTNVKLENNSHVPGSNSSAPDEQFDGLREEPASSFDRCSSGKTFSLPPRRHRRPNPHETKAGTVARYLPNVCENTSCSTLFPSTIRIGSTLNFSIVGQRGGHCPKCGTVGRVISGTYDCEHAELFIEGLSKQAVDYLEHFLVDFKAATTRIAREAVVERSLSGPEAKMFVQFFALLGDPRVQGLMVAATLAITAIGVMSQPSSSAPSPTVVSSDASCEVRLPDSAHKQREHQRTLPQARLRDAHDR